MKEIKLTKGKVALVDADQAYRVAELKYFGEFAREETKKLYQVV